MIVVYRLRSMPAQRSTRRPWSSCVTRTRRRRTRAASTPAAPWSRSPRTACRRRTPWRRRRATAARPPRPDRVLRRGPATTVAEEVGHGAAVGRRRDVPALLRLQVAPAGAAEPGGALLASRAAAPLHSSAGARPAAARRSPRTGTSWPRCGRAGSRSGRGRRRRRRRQLAGGWN